MATTESSVFLRVSVVKIPPTFFSKTIDNSESILYHRENVKVGKCADIYILFVVVCWWLIVDC